MLLIGSKALKHWVSESRPGRDYDLISTKEELQTLRDQNQGNILHDSTSNSGKKRHLRIGHVPVEVEFITPGSSNEILVELATGPTINVLGVDVKIADPAVLMVIKKSHLNYPINWWKHVQDYGKLKDLKPVLTARHQEALALRQKETKDRCGAAPKPNLMMTNEEFFGKSQKVVGRVFEHDDLHFSTCFYDRPMYEKLKTDQAMAWCDGKLFAALSHQDKIRCVQEEAFAIALERKVVPALNEEREYSSDLAFRYAVERIGTTLTGGWFREFTQENAREILNHGVDYVNRFLTYLEKKS